MLVEPRTACYHSLVTPAVRHSWKPISIEIVHSDMAIVHRNGDNCVCLADGNTISGRGKADRGKRSSHVAEVPDLDGSVVTWGNNAVVGVKANGSYRTGKDTWIRKQPIVGLLLMTLKDCHRLYWLSEVPKSERGIFGRSQNEFMVRMRAAVVEFALVSTEDVHHFSFLYVPHIRSSVPWSRNHLLSAGEPLAATDRCAMSSEFHGRNSNSMPIGFFVRRGESVVLFQVE